MTSLMKLNAVATEIIVQGSKKTFVVLYKHKKQVIC